MEARKAIIRAEMADIIAFTKIQCPGGSQKSNNKSENSLNYCFLNCPALAGNCRIKRDGYVRCFFQ
ncbi:MAG: hypothetical protein K6G11_07030 [Lachnospiraceae bacterium]|nr:hypothetical protein [Lachnospiraceae bacterium]